MEIVGDGIINMIVDENHNAYMIVSPKDFMLYETSKKHLNYYCCVVNEMAYVSSMAKCKTLTAYCDPAGVTFQRI